jgi:hypothetical protein
MIADEVNMNGETVRLILTEEFGNRKYVPVWSQESQGATAGCAVERSF